MIELMVHKKTLFKFILFMEKNKNFCDKYKINYSYVFLSTHMFLKPTLYFFFSFSHDVIFL